MLQITIPKFDTGNFSFGELSRNNKPRQVKDYEAHLQSTYKRYLWHELSKPHRDLWEWAEQINAAYTPPFIAIWPRGRGKSTHAEMIAADMGARDKRHYCMYVSGTQDQADKHVATIAAMLESSEVEQFNPAVSRPKIGKNGSRSWNRTTVKTASGYTIEAVGLNKAVRGQKIDWARPDLIIFDDIDERHDTENTIKKKREIITSSILPAGASNCAVLFVQNLIHAESIASELAKRPDEDGGAQYLTERTVSGPHQSVSDLRYEMQPDGEKLRWVITQGTSLWSGFDIAACEDELNRVGPDAFELESQHNIDADNPLALLKSEIFDATRRNDHPDLVQIAVGVDPSGGAGGCGIVASGKAKIGGDWHGFTVDNRSTPLGTPSAEWAEQVLWCYYANQADVIAVEDNFGGDMVENNIRNAAIKDADGKILLAGKNVPIVRVHASRGKEVRAQPVATLFQLGKMHHVGRYPKLQRQWTSWTPGTKPSPDELDAEVWAVTHLEIADHGATWETVADLGSIEDYQTPWDY